MNMKRMRFYVVLGVALLLSGSPFVNSGWSETERDILSFVSKKGEDSPIILMNTGGAILERLTTDPGKPSNFTWSPNGRSITYDSWQGGNFDIYVMDVEANTHRQLTFDGIRDQLPVWSPNGKWIAFISDRAGGKTIYRMDVNGENVKQLINKKDCRKPAWSPDSQWIAFSSEHSLWVMDAEGRRLRELTWTTRSSECSWSPDGKQIAYMSNAPNGGSEVFSIDVNGKNRRQLTRTDGPTIIRDPVWSPSGKWIAYIVGQIPFGGAWADQIMTNGVVSLVNTVNGAGGKPIEATKGLPKQSLQWRPKRLLSVSPSAEKQTTLWGKLKQPESTTK
ncbi:hypothetical protein C6503_01360 [Candidatus Poribacteria bacterium]|nr:MAG: hypothetical protein C6503_01360 [Candidatus Poribacteria bacterium]